MKLKKGFWITLICLFAVSFQLHTSGHNIVTGMNIIPDDYRNLEWHQKIADLNIEGKNNDEIISSAIDQENNIIVSGNVFDINGEYTTYDAFVSKFTQNGLLLWTTTFGGQISDESNDIDIDDQGNIIVVGVSQSSDFPIDSSTYVGTQPVAEWGTIVKLSPLGVITWSTVFNGHIKSVAFDNQDNFIVAGSIHFEFANVPLVNANDATFEGDSEIFLTKFNPEGEIIWSTYIGGNGADSFERDIELITDKNSNIILAGTTDSSDFEITNDDYAIIGQTNVFVQKIDTSGNVVFSTLLGSSGISKVEGLSIDDDNSYFISGTTQSIDFPTLNAADPDYNFAKDTFVTKLNSNGEVTMSTYLGGAGDDLNRGISIDSNKSLFVVGRTGSLNFPTGQFSDSLNEGSDIYISKFQPTGEIVWSRIIGGDSSDVANDISIDNDDNLIVTGSTKSIGSTDRYPVQNAYPYSFGGDVDGFITKLNASGDIIWSTTAPVVTSPNSKLLDADNLNNQEEFEATTDPNNPDTDGDLLPDDWEVQFGLDPLLDSASDDPDGDGWANRFEFQSNTFPNDSDTDGDRMPDGWEAGYFLKPLINDSYSDADNDEIPNLYEYYWGLDPQTDDAQLDKDEDGLTNLYEFQNGLMGNNTDTDGDGFPDGWEVDTGRDPLDPSDFDKDKDGDFIPDGFEYESGFMNPNEPYELYFVLILLTISIATYFTLIFRRRKWNKNAIALGYTNYKDLKESISAGFENPEEELKANANGFLNANVRNIVLASGSSNVSEMILRWENVIEIIETTFTKVKTEKLLQLISETISPIKLRDVMEVIQPVLGDIEIHRINIERAQFLLQAVLEIEIKSPGANFVHLTLDDINKAKENMEVGINSLQVTENTIMTGYESRTNWFTPWEQLLILIQMTEDRIPIELSEISKVVKAEESHAEQLIQLLLSENELIGVYDKTTKVYTKGVKIDSYLDLILSKLKLETEDE